MTKWQYGRLFMALMAAFNLGTSLARIAFGTYEFPLFPSAPPALGPILHALCVVIWTRLFIAYLPTQKPKEPELEKVKPYELGGWQQPDWWETVREKVKKVR